MFALHIMLTYIGTFDALIPLWGYFSNFIVWDAAYPETQNKGGKKNGCKMTYFYPTNGFDCHFQWLSPMELKFYMQQQNICIIFSYFMGKPPKMQ